MTTMTMRYTETAQQSIEDQIEYLAAYHGLEPAYQKVGNVIDVLQDKLLSTPVGYPVSPQASELGILQYRELNTDGYRVFYEIVEADQAIVVGLVNRASKTPLSATVCC